MFKNIWIDVSVLAGLFLLIWVTIAITNYYNAAPARAYAATQTATTSGSVVVVQQPQNDSGWNLFFYGYLLGGFGNYGGYGGYVNSVQNNYYSSPQYQSGQTYDSSSGSWGSDEDTNDSGDSTSFGSDDDSSSVNSDSSDDESSWGSDDSSDSSDDSGSWGGDDGGSSGGGSFGSDDD